MDTNMYYVSIKNKKTRCGGPAMPATWEVEAGRS
jgi:hypothetical protein